MRSAAARISPMEAVDLALRNLTCGDGVQGVERPITPATAIRVARRGAPAAASPGDAHAAGERYGSCIEDGLRGSTR
jgi:hypothetical protein